MNSRLDVDGRSGIGQINFEQLQVSFPTLLDDIEKLAKGSRTNQDKVIGDLIEYFNKKEELNFSNCKNIKSVEDMLQVFEDLKRL